MTETPEEPPFQPDPHLPVPEMIGNYKIDRLLGSGGMGTVYLGYHSESGMRAAVKMLPPAMAHQEGFVARFNREIEAMRQLDSPQIVKLYESGEDHGTYYYAMEYVPGETLTERLKRTKRIPWREAIDLTVQVCKALKSAHNAGIVHRDLKPSNLLIQSDGTVKLSDFGIAQIFATSKLTITGGILGTAEYMSPEQALGRRVTRHSDIYSLGAVLYVMLTGRPPFTGKTTLDVLQKHKYSQFDSPRRIVSDIPHWLDEIVCQCLAKKPEERYTDAYVLQLRLQEVPKKVDLQQAHDESDHEGLTDSVTAADSAHHMDQISSGTLARDLFRFQIESDAQRSRLGKVMNNVWVLLTLLILLISGATYLYLRQQLTPEQMFAKVEELMGQPEGPAWDEAREKHMTKLIEIDSQTWAPKLEPYQSQFQIYDLKRQFSGRGLFRRPNPKSEPEAILKQVFELRQQGHLDEAVAKLTALETLISGHPPLQSMSEAVAILKKDLLSSNPLSEPVNSSRFDYVRLAFERAERLRSRGEVDQARAIWQSTVDLYANDPAAGDLVRIARRELSLSEEPAKIPASEQSTPSPAASQGEL